MTKLGYWAASLLITTIFLQGVKVATTCTPQSLNAIPSGTRTGITRFGISSNGRFSESIGHGGVVYLSGQIGKGDNIKEACIAALADVDHALQLAGTDKSKLVSVTVYLKNILRDYAGMNEVYDKWLVPGKPPCRATVEANLADPLWLIEIHCIATH